MIGNGYWSTGIIVEYVYSGMGQMGWTAKADFLDGGFCNDNPEAGIVSTEGEVRSRYAVRNGETAHGLAVAVDAVKADVERLGIEWRNPRVYYPGDGEDGEHEPPQGWQEMLGAQADRLGWQRLYGPHGEEAEAVSH